MKRMILVPVIGIAALAASGVAQAQSIGWGGRPQAAYADTDRRSYYDSQRVAYDNGYREGAKEGQKEGRKGERFRFEDEKTYQRADKGYHREFGDVQRYRQSFRSGYAAGYSEAYQRNAAYDPRDRGRDGDWRPGYGSGRAVPRGDSRGPVYYPDNRYPDNRGYPADRYPDSRYPTGAYRANGVAFQNGIQDGYEKGQEDANRGRSFDPLRHAWYRSGDRHYDSRSGSRDQYRDLYRRGFQDGYDRGYREGRYR